MADVCCIMTDALDVLRMPSVAHDKACVALLVLVHVDTIMQPDTIALLLCYQNGIRPMLDDWHIFGSGAAVKNKKQQGGENRVEYRKRA